MIDDDREWLESGKGRPPGVRPEILTSWRRSRLNGVDPERFAVAPGAAPLESRVARAGIPVLEATADLMIGADTSLLLSSPDGTVLWRWSESSRLDAMLDRSSVVVGVRMSEDVAGTNGIGTSLETVRPIMISGTEHFNEALHPFTCAGAPILDPITHRVAGTLSVTSMVEQSSPLMKTVLQMLAREIEDRLLDESTMRERELLRQFREQRRLGRSPVVAFNDAMLITDRVGAAVGVERVWLSEQLEAGTASDDVLDVGPANRSVVVIRSPISYRGSVIGVIAVGEPAKTQAAPCQFTDSIERPFDRRWVDLVDLLRELITGWDRVLISGESGVGKRTMVHQVLDDPDCPIGELDCVAVAEMGPRHWLATARAMLSDNLAQGGTILLFSHLESLTNRQARAVGRILDQLPRGADAVRIVGTYTSTSDEPGPGTQALLDRFHSETFEIPPLRQRQTDLISILSGEETAHPALSPEAIELLRHHPWPGNHRQLNEFRRWLEKQQRPVIGVPDLPAKWSRGAGRAHLTAIQAAEADAMEMALRTCHGNKSAAALALGLSRSSLYRKMREYRLT